MKFSPENITSLAPNQVFVFGANEKGIHGAGAAKTALRWGAVMGSYGAMKDTYGIPTKDQNIETLPISKIKKHVYDFLTYAFANKQTEFLVTKIGCGLAGLSEEEVAPLFQDVIDQEMTNVLLPESFHKYLEPFDSIRPIVVIKESDEAEKIAKRINFQITGVYLRQLGNGFLALSVDWTAEGPDKYAVKYAKQDSQSSSFLLNNWKELSSTIKFGEELNHTWKTEDGVEIEDVFSIDIGIRYNSRSHDPYDYVCFHNTKWGAIAYFAPHGWNFTNNGGKILSEWSIYKEENEN